jgi:hypothetical protein
MFADVKGRIIHKILQQEIEKPELRDAAERMVKNEIDLFKNNNIADELVEEVVSDLSRLYDSENFLEIKNFSDYHNEFEVYTKESNYFLYGIIDKLIFEGKKGRWYRVVPPCGMSRGGIRTGKSPKTVQPFLPCKLFFII